MKIENNNKWKTRISFHSRMSNCEKMNAHTNLPVLPIVTNPSFQFVFQFLFKSLSIFFHSRNSQAFATIKVAFTGLLRPFFQFSFDRLLSLSIFSFHFKIEEGENENSRSTLFQSFSILKAGRIFHSWVGSLSLAFQYWNESEWVKILISGCIGDGLTMCDFEGSQGK